MRLGRVSRRWRTVRLCCVMNSRTVPMGTSSPRALASSNSSRSACARISRSRWARIEAPRASGLSAPSSPSLIFFRATHTRHLARSYFPWPSLGIPSRTNRCTVRGVMPSTRASLSTLTSFANQCPHRSTKVWAISAIFRTPCVPRIRLCRIVLIIACTSQTLSTTTGTMPP